MCSEVGMVKQPIDWHIETTAETPKPGTNQTVRYTALSRTQPPRPICTVSIEVALETKAEVDGVYGTNAVATVASELCRALFERHPDGYREDAPLLVMRPFIRQLRDGSYEAYVDMGLIESQAPTNHPSEKAARDMLKQLMGNHHHQGYIIEVGSKRYEVASHHQAAYDAPLAVEGGQ